MSAIGNIADERMRCPRCRAYPMVQSAIELRPRLQYLTLRCNSCAIVYDAQVPSPAALSETETHNNPASEAYHVSADRDGPHR